MNIWLVNFPLPPSVNEYLMPVAARNGKGSRWVKTASHTKYLQKCHEWRLLHNRSFTEVRDVLHKLVSDHAQRGHKLSLRVDCFFAFEHSRLWTAHNTPQSLDADNRLKPCRDALATLLGIDDKYFFGGFFEKVSTTKDKECTYLRISQMTPRTLMDLKSQMQRETNPGT